MYDGSDYEKEMIEDAVKKIENGEAKFFKHEDVVKWLESWGTENELQPPS